MLSITRSASRLDLIAACAFALLVAGTYFVYAPGISGGFMFDDEINLDALGRLGGIDDWRTLVDFLLGSHTGAGGRPIALASFLLDGNDWPTAPEPFKYTNIMLHMLTMVGVIWLSLQLAAALGYQRGRQYVIAILAGAVWGLHPFLVSTVLYVVQRMAILAAMFVIFGLGCYAQGRRLLDAGRSRAGYAWMTVGIAGFTPLAILSKPNGGLLPLLALVLDVTILSGFAAHSTEQHRLRVWRSVFIYLPIAAIIGYFVVNWDTRILNGYGTRSFTLVERLLTEPRILIEYLGHHILPRIQTSGLYHDNYPFSTGLLSPPATLLAIAAVLAAIALCIAYRRRFPVLSAGLLFFFAGHSVESTFVPLELYFEHRNYLPSVLLAFALAVGLVRLSDTKALDHPKPVAGIAAILVVAVLATFTTARSNLWGDPQKLALTWETENPGSIRVQQQAAMVYMNLGMPHRASQHLARGLEHNPDSSLLRVQQLIPLCVVDSVTADPIDKATESIRQQTFNEHTIDQLNALAGHAMANRCSGLDVGGVLRMTEAALSHSGVQQKPSMVEELEYLRGRLLLHEDQVENAQKAFMRAAWSTRNVEGAIQMAAIMASAEHYRRALALLEHAEQDLRSHESDLRARFRRTASDYRSEIERMRTRIREDQRQANTM